MLKVIAKLKEDLLRQGIDVFNNSRIVGKEYSTTCPFHKGGNEKRPSFGILLERDGKKRAGLCHCFSCGWSGSIEKLVSELFGYNDNGVFGHEWMKGNFNIIEIRQREPVCIDTERFIPEIEYFTGYDTYRNYSEYWETRGINAESVKRYDLGYDLEKGAVTFPVRDKRGNILYVATRSIKNKVFYYPKSSIKPLYGVYEYLNDIVNEELYLTESMIDTIYLRQFGYNSVALNGLGTKAQIDELSKLPYRVLIVATDNDVAGESVMKKVKEKITGKLIYRINFPEGRKDVNEFSTEEMKNISYSS